MSAAVNYTIAVPEADLSIVVFDSPRACPSYMSAPYGDCNELCMLQLAQLGCTNATEREGAPTCFLEHVRWLNATLAALTTKWKFVAAHHPIDQEASPQSDQRPPTRAPLTISARPTRIAAHPRPAPSLGPGQLGSDPPQNVKFVVPALKAHGVQAMFAGHIHNLQHNVGADGVHYFISGAGAFASALAEGVAAVRAGASTHAPRLLTCPAGAACFPLKDYFFADGPGFLAVSVGDAEAEATFFHQNGTALYTAQIAP